jgi:hypothetical protein
MALELPKLTNGIQLTYRYPSDTVSPDYYWRTNPVNEKALIRSVKEQLPQVCLWPRKKVLKDYMSVIAADFDTLTSNVDFIRICSDYGFGLVTRSVSNKIKVLFPVKHKEWMDHGRAVHILKTLLSEEDFKIVDKSLGAFTTTYVNKRMLEEMSDIGNLAYIDGNKILKGYEENQLANVKTRYHTYKGELPEFIKFFIGDNKDKETFARIILSTYNLLSSRGGFGLSIAVLSAQCNVAKTTASRWLKDLEKLNLIKCTDPNWIYGKKAKIYESCWMLTNFIKDLMKNSNPTNKQKLCLKPGEAFLYLLNETKYYKFEELDTIPGINPKGLLLAKRIWKTHQKKNRLLIAS